MTNMGTAYYITASSHQVIRAFRAAMRGRGAVQARGLRIVARSALPLPYVAGITVHNADQAWWSEAVPAWLGVSAR